MYVFSLSASTGLPADIAHTVISGNEGAYLGDDLASVGDITGDGVIDVAIGSPSYGDVYLFSGSVLAQGGNITVSDSLATLGGGTFHGIDVHSIGDVDGDGVTDLATGTGAYYDASASISVWSGAQISAGGSFGDPDTLVKLTGNGIGSETAGGVDFDGDGFDDLAAAYQTGTSPNISIVSGTELVVGGNLGLDDYAVLTGSASNSDGDPTSFAKDLGVSEDLDGDGYAELLVAASTTDTAFASAGVVYIIDGDQAVNGGSVINVADIAIEGAEDCAELSTNDRSGDYDGDGIPDIIVSQLNTDALNCQSSLYPTTHVFYGAELESGTYLSTDTVGQFISRDYSDAMGAEGLAFDMDYDGDDDLLLGAPRKRQRSWCCICF